jgi:hypothetical protein
MGNNDTGLSIALTIIGNKRKERTIRNKYPILSFAKNIFPPSSRRMLFNRIYL